MIRNGQGPQSEPLLLIGSGRLARHLRFYLQQTSTPLLTWSRKENHFEDLKSHLAQSSRVALAISDDALLGFSNQYLRDFHGEKIHFSGALHDEALIAAHPLMSFGPDLYPADFYPRIHFALTGVNQLTSIFPHWKNPFSLLSPQDKGLYHALCVMGGNFPILLWRKMETELTSLGLPEEGIRLYIEQVARNYGQKGPAALTGPLIRKDQQTIKKNLSALSGDPWQKIYLSFKEVIHEHS